ncbi:MAG: elongation factor 4 [Armatimonadetes bacterium]|nr:elongation factor 4 [Armatimonadota bacterium]
MSRELIRNFSIIAHIDHGKSTLADRLLEYTGTLAPRQLREQVLDTMDLERERGITIKAHPIRMEYRALDGGRYYLNLIDTPGHVDFSYEVFRPLAASEGVLLVVDASQGVEAQTVANFHLANDRGLKIIPVLNKIDLPAADPGRVLTEIEETFMIPREEALLVSAKEGIGIEEVLEAIVTRIPSPGGMEQKPLRALIFDSYYDQYRGVIIYVRVVDGAIRPGMRIKPVSSDKIYTVDEVGILTLDRIPLPELAAGTVGYLIAQIKSISDITVGDTVTCPDAPALESLPGFRQITPMVYCGLYPIETLDYNNLREALEKLKLNDASLTYEPETSAALGMGFRCGFLGLLHAEIVQERLEREYRLNLIATAPSVEFRVTTTRGDRLKIDNPSDLPPPTVIAVIEEPVARVTLLTPEEYVGSVMDLAQGRRGNYLDMEYISGGRVMLTYEIPLGEIISNFFDQLKSRTRGYASMDYLVDKYQEADLVKLDILVQGVSVDALSTIVHQDRAHALGHLMVERLKETIPRQLYEVPIQAAVGGRVVARETVKALRKNVLAKCYGGDITRKRKLLEKQKAGKKRMKQIGSVEIPQEAFLSVLRLEEL